MRPALRWAAGGVFVGLILACSGELGHRAGQLFPFLKKSHPELQYPPVDCDAELEAPPDRDTEKTCISHTPFEQLDDEGESKPARTLRCGDQIEGTTVGAPKALGDSFYGELQLSPFGEGYDQSGEAVYELIVEKDVQAQITLVSPCADLDLFAFRYKKGTEQCPNTSRPVGETERSITPSAVEQIQVTTPGKKGTFLVIIDGKRDPDGGGQHGNYRLEVRCTQ